MSKEKHLREEIKVAEGQSVVMDDAFKQKLKNKSRGINCPTCGRTAKEYKRKLTANLCIALIEVLKWYRHNPKEVSELDYFNVNDLFKNNQRLKVDFPKLQYWDLIEAKGKMVKNKFVKNYNMYRISENGIKFAQREVAVPLVAVVYNNIVQGHLINPHATIDQILSESGYDYDSLINPNTIIKEDE